MTTTPNISLQPIDAYVVALDETTHYFISPADRPYIEQIRGAYLFDRNQCTHCCELTPSYYLIYLYNQVLLTEKGNALDDHAQNRLFQQYEHYGDDCYVHCHTVERIIERNKPQTVCHYGNPEVDQQDVEYNEQMDALQEHFCSNCPF